MQLSLFQNPKETPKNPKERPKGFSGDIISNVKERIRKRNHCVPEAKLKEWIESNWHHDLFDDNTGYDVAMLILLDVPTSEILKLFN